MPPRNPELPEGTDHIISGAMETGTGAGASTGSSGGTGAGGGTTLGAGTTGGGTSTTTGGTSTTTGGTGTTTGGTGGNTGGTGGSTAVTAATTGGATGGAFVASSGGDDTGGTSTNRGGGGAAKGAANKIVSGVKSQVSSLTDQATAKAREYADQGKDRATSALDEFAEVINDAARSIDERLGSQYGEYAHRAAGAVTSLSQNLRGKTVDELLEDSRSVVRKSPGIAIGTAAVLGFALVRLVKAGLDEGNDVQFTAESGRSIDFEPDTGGGTSGKGA
ncbi:MAG: hypothetical protein M3N39_06070 [Pseudomonadota bacterium]|nr:hypothetical protein [Pseudomonadota bacterium]